MRYYVALNKQKTIKIGIWKCEYLKYEIKIQFIINARCSIHRMLKYSQMKGIHSGNKISK